MSNKISLKKSIAVILSFVLLFTILFPNKIHAENTKTTSDVLVEKIEDNANQLTLKGTKNGSSLILTQDKKTLKISMAGDAKLFEENSAQSFSTNANNSSETIPTPANYNVEINDIKSNEEIDATFTNIETGKSVDTLHNTTGEVTPQLVFLVPLGVIIGEALLASLIATAVAIEFGGVAYATISAIKDRVKNDKYDHYAAKIVQGNVWIGPSLSLAQASARLGGISIQENNVWSKNSTLASAVARAAGGGRKPEGPELQVEQKEGIFYYVHYHTWNRAGGHSFF